MMQTNELKRVDLSEWTLVSERADSRTYTSTDRKWLLKIILSCEGQLESLIEEQRISNAMCKLGISTPKVGGIVETNDGALGIIYQNIVDKESLARGIANHPENYQMYMHKYADIMDALHATECDVQSFDYVADAIKESAEQLDCLTDFHRERIAEFLDSLPKETTCVLGDGHLGNVITSPMGDYLIDINHFAYGSPYFDESVMYYFLKLVVDEGLKNVMHLTREQAAICWDYWCREIKGITTEEEKTAYENMLKPYVFCILVKHGPAKEKAYINILHFMNDCGLF